LPKQIATGTSEDFQVIYYLILDKDDCLGVKIEITNIQSSIMTFAFWKYGSGLGVVKDLKTVFKNIKVKMPKGELLVWKLEGNNEIIVNHGYDLNFVIKYSANAHKFMVFP